MLPWAVAITVQTPTMNASDTATEKPIVKRPRAPPCCSICKLSGHKKSSCPSNPTPPSERVVEQEKPAVVESIVPEATLDAELDDMPYYSQIEPLVISVVDELGGGHSESTYRNAMQVGLRHAGIQHESERSLSIEFRGEHVGLVRADLVVEKSLVIELKILGNDEGKTVETTLIKAQEQCRIYMRKTGIVHGLVIGFPDREGKKAIIRAVR